MRSQLGTFTWGAAPSRQGPRSETDARASLVVELVPSAFRTVDREFVIGAEVGAPSGRVAAGDLAALDADQPVRFYPAFVPSHESRSLPSPCSAHASSPRRALAAIRPAS